MENEDRLQMDERRNIMGKMPQAFKDNRREDVAAGLTNGNGTAGVAPAAALLQVLNLIRRHDGISRRDLQEITGLSRSTLSQRLEPLRRLGLVVPSGHEPSAGGRRPETLRFNAAKGMVLGIDLGATSVDMALTDLAGGLLGHVSEPLDVAQGPRPVLKHLVQLAQQLLEEHSSRHPAAPGCLVAIGMGVPGPVEFSTGRPVSPPIMPGWDLFDIRGYFREQGFACPVFIDNDVNIMALGERWMGAGRGVDNFLFVKVGTGIGCGVIAHGDIYRGSQGCAGDIGHIAVDGQDVLCRCGNRGCLEALAGGHAIGRQAEEAATSGKSPQLAARKESRGRLTAEDVAFAASQGDPVSVEIIRRSGHHIGTVLASLVNFFNPSLILIGGGVSNIGDSFLAAIREVVYRRSLPLATRDLVIQRSALGGQAGILGAAALAIEEVFTAEQFPALLQCLQGPADAAAR